MQSEAHRRANKKWDAGNMAAVTVHMRRSYVDALKAYAAERGTTAPALLREYALKLINAPETAETSEDGGAE